MLVLCTFLLLLSALTPTHASTTTLAPDVFWIESSGLQPESIVFSRDYGFVVSSIKNGSLFTVDPTTGSIQFLVGNEQILSSVGFQLVNDTAYICHGNRSVLQSRQAAQIVSCLLTCAALHLLDFRQGS
jgi:hypothetical protein